MSFSQQKNGNEQQHRPSPSTAEWFSRFVQEVIVQSKTAAPTLASMLLYRFPWLISLRFVGGIGASELAAAALASTLCNVTGLSISVGLSSAMTTLTGQSRGELQARRKQQQQSHTETEREQSELLLDTASEVDKTSYGSTQTKHDEKKDADTMEPLLPLIFLYRGVFVQFLFVLPIGSWWLWGIEPFLLALGQGDDLSSMTTQYLRILTPGLWSYSINWTITCWLQAIEMADVPAWAAAFGLALHIPMNIFFIYTLDWGYLGSAYATVVFQLVQPMVMIFYLFQHTHGRDRVLKNLCASSIGRTSLSLILEAKIAASSMDGVVQYLSLALPGIVAISEWWASEIAIFLAGRLTPSPELALGGMALYQSMNSFCFMFPVSLSIAGSARIGNLLGAGEPIRARFAGYVTVLCSAVVSATLGAILFWTPHTFFPSLFAPTELDLAQETSATVPLLAWYVVADGIQSAFNGIVKGCGRQAVTIPIVIGSYWIVGVPLAYYLAFVRNDGIMCDTNFFCGIVGLTAGLTTATWLHMSLLMAAVVFGTDWISEARRASSRLGKQSGIARRS